MPLITDDTGMPMFGLFHTDNLLPSAVYIDHTMTVQYKQAGHDSESSINERMQGMLDNLYGAPILAINTEVLMDDELDNDGVLNPGEGFSVIYTFTNNSFETNAFNAVASLSIDSEANIITNENIEIGDILLGETVYSSFSILLDDTIPLGSINLSLLLTAEYINNFNEIVEYSKEIELDLDISLNQTGFPVSTPEIRSSPLVIDLDGDGDMEIIIGDNNGFVHIYNYDGTEIVNEIFPFDTGNQIWGSSAAADMDRDGNLDFVITSKSKHLYIFDQYGLKVDYNANKYLMGSPAIGNLDDDEDLEVVIGGYSSNNQIFVINHDGSDVDGFPLNLGEKTKAGVALADYNGNGKDDIILGTDNDNIYLIFDNGTIASGFPYVASDKFQSSPTIIDVDGEKIIFAGSNDNSLYAINSDGSLKFSISTGDKVLSSPSLLDYNDQKYIFFGSNDNMIYAVDINGNALDGWPITIDGKIGGSVVFSDFDNDGDPELVASTDFGNVLAFNLDGTYVDYFPLYNGFPSLGSPMIIDLDLDGDLEILAGSGSNLFVIDIKDQGSIGEYWNVFKSNSERNGCRFYSLNDDECNSEIGDLNADGNWNILDIVQLSNCILSDSCFNISNGCAGDLNTDGNWNILDIVQLANLILES